MTSSPQPLPRSLLVALACLGVALSATVVAGPFTIDESNQLVSVLALREGGVHLGNTAGLPASAELRWFDPSIASGRAAVTPVASTAPPLYAVLALPFSFLGWRGLVLLNTIAFLAAIAIAFAHARRFGARPETPWIAAVATGLGGYFLEYAQGVWPHMLSMALVAAAVYCASRTLDDSTPRWAASAGLLAAFAAGVRYQNAFVLGCLALGLFVLARHRVRATLALCAGALLPLALASWMNHARVGSWNPISKGPGYVTGAMPALVGAPGYATAADHPWRDAGTMAWARVVDYTARPRFSDPAMQRILSPHPESGAYQVVTAAKKAWLQSAPWLFVPLAVFVLAWAPAAQFRRVADAASQRPLRLLSLVVLATIAMFSARGPLHTSGLCFNQRYFAELLPLAAVALAWSLPALRAERSPLLGGTFAGLVLALVALRLDPSDPLRHRLLMGAPLVLAVAFGAAWAWSSVAPARRLLGAVLAAMLAACLAWGLAVHVGDDLAASRRVRGWREARLRELAPALPERAAIFASGAAKDALGPLAFGRDLVIAAPDLDDAATTRVLIDAFLAGGRRVFLLPGAIAKERLPEVLAGKRLHDPGDAARLFEVK